MRRGRTPPLRKRNKRCNGRATARVAPTKALVGADDPVRPMWVCNIFVGQGPCALPRVREKSGSGRCRHRPLRKRILWCVGEGLSCPPSCQPTDGHCCARQSGHFLETGSLHPPLAARRRFPLPRATARVAPTERFVGADDPVRPMWVCNIFVGQGPCALPMRGGIPQSRLRRASPL